MPKFNCMYCAAPCDGEAGRMYSCPRCGKGQAVPASPPFFFPFHEGEIHWIATVMQGAQKLVQESKALKLDGATERALKDVSSGLPTRLAGLTGGSDPRLQDLINDAPLIAVHGYGIGRAVLGTLDSPRELKAVVDYTSLADFAATLKHSIFKLRQQGNLKSLDGVSAFCMREAYNRWIYYEMETRGLREWSAVITGEIDRMLGDAYLLALIEETYFRDGVKALKSKGLAAPAQPTPMPGPMRKDPPPAPTLTPPPGTSPMKAVPMTPPPQRPNLTPMPRPTPNLTPTPARPKTVISSGIMSGLPAAVVNTPRPGPLPFVTSATVEKMTLTALMRVLTTGAERFVEAEFWGTDAQGHATFAGYKFYDASGAELSKERFLRHGQIEEMGGKGSFQNTLNLSQFLAAHGSQIAKVLHIVDAANNETVVYSDSESFARPLADFFELMQKEARTP